MPMPWTQGITTEAGVAWTRWMDLGGLPLMCNVDVVSDLDNGPPFQAKRWVPACRSSSTHIVGYLR